MTIDKYFDIIESLLSKLNVAKESRLSFEKDSRGTIGRIKGTIYLEDDTFLKVFEDIRVEERGTAPLASDN
jgi:hypothetical protein